MAIGSFDGLNELQDAIVAKKLLAYLVVNNHNGELAFNREELQAIDSKKFNFTVFKDSFGNFHVKVEETT